MPKKLPKQVRVIQEHKKKKIDYENEKTISFSQFYTFNTCPHQWYLTYVKKLAPYQPSVHAVFGTALHETLQQWLDVAYNKTIKASMEMDLNSLLLERIRKTFKKERYKNSNTSFSSSEELQEFYEDGLSILNFIKKKRSDYFNSKYTYLVGSEILLIQEIRPSLFFKGYIDLLFYDSFTNRYKIVDIKTSTKGWNDYAKKDEAKIAQLILYKEFLSKQFDIDIESIDIEYLILKRKLPEDSEFSPKHVQRFIPSSGKIKRGKILKMFYNFVETGFDQEGNYKKIDFEKVPSLNNCRFCPFKTMKPLCNVSIT